MFLYIIAFIFGTIFGNFATTFIHRIPNKKPLAGKYLNGIQPHCATCNHILKANEYLPIINLFTARGKCRNCGTTIPKIYYFTEYFIACISMLYYFLFSFSSTYTIMLLLTTALFTSIATLYRIIHIKNKRHNATQS